jgi:hypothetical protein
MMIRLQQYLMASSSLGGIGGVLHGFLTAKKKGPQEILVDGLQGLIIGPYAPIIIPYVAISGPKICPSFNIRSRR